MKIDFNMLGASMESRVCREVCSTNIVTPKGGGGGREKNAKITKQRLKPNKFSSSGGKGAIFRFSAGAGDGALFAR
jgi:hypothetical protein